MKLESLFLKAVVFIFGIVALAISIFFFPKLAEIFAEWLPMLAFLQYPFLISLYISIITFYYALYQTLKLLNYVDKNLVFSEISIKAISHIKLSAIVISFLFLLDIPLIYLMADISDAPGILLIGLAFIFASIVIAIFASLIENVIKGTLDKKPNKDIE